MFLSVIVSYYNEKKNIRNNVDKIYKYFHNKFDFEIILIDDGINSELKKLFSDNKFNNIKIIENKSNYGKGYSIRKGIKHSKGKLILLTDSDLSTPIHQFDKLHKEYLRGNDIVIGSRSVSGSKIKKKQVFLRRLVGRIFNLIVRLFLGLKLNDTQCGFKLFNGKKIKEIILKCFVNRFCIDAEILFLAKKFNCNIKEVGIEWHNDNLSSVNLKKDILNMLIDLIKIKIKHL